MSVGNSLKELENIRKKFPAFEKMDANHQVYLDSAATTQTPQFVIDALSHFYSNPHGNVHRSGHLLGNQSTTQFEKVRQRCADFIHASYADSIVWTRGATESLNCIIHSWAEHHLQTGDVVLLSELEHHANLIPWQQWSRKKGVELSWIPVNKFGNLDLKQAETLLSAKVKCVALSHASNVTGTLNDVSEFFRKAREQGVVTILDSSQTVAHCEIDVQELHCDFMAFSSHKMYGPKGVGVLYVSESLFPAMHPWQMGGEMVSRVDFYNAEFQSMPLLLESGTPNISGVIAFGAALKFLQGLEQVTVAQYENDLLAYLEKQLAEIKELSILGKDPDDNLPEKVPLLSFTSNKHHAFDMASLLNEQGVFVRSGKHCAMPLLTKLGLNATLRVSIGLYNHKKDIDIFIKKLKNTLSLLG